MEQFLHANERKFSNTERATIYGPAFQQVPAEANWPRFVSFVSDLNGVITPDTNSDQSAGKVLAFWDQYFQCRRGSP